MSEAPAAQKKNAPDEFHSESESESALGDTAHVAEAAVFNTRDLCSLIFSFSNRSSAVLFNRPMHGIPRSRFDPAVSFQ